MFAYGGEEGIYWNLQHQTILSLLPIEDKQVRDKTKVKMFKLAFSLFCLFQVCLAYYVPLTIEFMGNKGDLVNYDLDRNADQVRTFYTFVSQNSK